MVTSLKKAPNGKRKMTSGENAVLRSWARAIIGWTWTVGMHGSCNEVPVMVMGEPGDRPIRPDGRFVIGRGGDGNPALTGRPDWVRDTVLTEHRPLVLIPSTPEIIIDPGFTYGRPVENAELLLHMYEVESWPGATEWLTGAVQHDMLKKWANKYGSGHVRDDCPPFGLLLDMMDDGGPGPKLERYAGIINNGSHVSPRMFRIIDDMCVERFGEGWAAEVTDDMSIGAEKTDAFEEDPSLLHPISRILHLAGFDAGLHQPPRERKAGWRLLHSLMEHRADDMMELVDYLDDGRAAFVARSMLEAQDTYAPEPGDECIVKWNPFPSWKNGWSWNKVLNDIPLSRIMRSDGVRGDVERWMDLTMDWHTPGRAIGAERLERLCGQAVSILERCAKAEPKFTGSHVRYWDINVGSITGIMTGEETAGADAVCGWVDAHDRDMDYNRLRNFIRNAIIPMITSGDMSDRTIALMRLFRIATRWMDGGGDIDTLMDMAVECIDLVSGDDSIDCASGWVLVFQAWVGGRYRGLPIRFVMETIMADDDASRDDQDPERRDIL